MRIFVFLFISFLCWSSPAQAQEYSLQKLQIDGKIQIEVQIAETPRQQTLGLGFRKELKEGKGMLFSYSFADERIFWMKNMLISIDILWIRNGKVVHIEPRAPPPSLLTIKLPTYGHGILADQVLELPAGFAEKQGIRVGSLVEPIR